VNFKESGTNGGRRTKPIRKPGNEEDKERDKEEEVEKKQQPGTNIDLAVAEDANNAIIAHYRNRAMIMAVSRQLLLLHIIATIAIATYIRIPIQHRAVIVAAPIYHAVSGLE
jgi:hypothetical protein